MSYKWPGIPNGDYSFDHGRAVWNKIINYLRRLSEKLDADIVDATADRRGMMTAADKDKLDGVEPGAEVNQNAFSGVKVGNSTIEADGKTDVLELAAGTGIELTVDTTNDKVTIGGKEATTTAAGLMSATDKSKLDGIAAGAEVNQNAFSNIQVGPAIVAADSKTDTLTLGPGAGVIISANTTNDSITIGCVEASQSVPGIMSTTDKTKLDGITAGAEPNLNAFSNVKVGSTVVAADVKTDTLELVAGSNVTLTPDAANDKVTIAATDTTYNNFTGASANDAGSSGLVPAPAAGENRACLMGFGGWGLPTYINTTEATLNSARPVWFSFVDDTQRPCYNTGFTYNPGTGNLVVGTINGFTIEKSVPSNAVFTDTTYSVVTQSADGLMSANDKKLLDGAWSRSSGTVRKFEDGTMMQYTSRIWTDSSTDYTSVTFSEPFIAPPAVGLTFFSTTGATNQIRVSEITATGFKWAYRNGTAYTNGASASFIAIGRWK